MLSELAGTVALVIQNVVTSLSEAYLFAVLIDVTSHAVFLLVRKSHETLRLRKNITFQPNTSLVAFNDCTFRATEQPICRIQHRIVTATNKREEMLHNFLTKWFNS